MVTNIICAEQLFKVVDVHSKSDHFFKGMVEKWLLQVEKLMLSSVRHVIHRGLLNYTEVHNTSCL